MYLLLIRAGSTDNTSVKAEADPNTAATEAETPKSAKPTDEAQAETAQTAHSIV